MQLRSIIASVVITASLFASGVAVGFAAQKPGVWPYRDKSNQEAALAMLELAKVQADGGSWERIAIGRIYYLSGSKPAGQAIFDEVLADEPEPSDLFRIARVYREAGEWSQAKALFDRYVSEKPKDSSGMAEVGAYYLMQGDRAAAEALFDRSFKREPNVWATVAAAGSYLGVTPQE
ncbi:tetratricopeptide repeat protein [Lysobacter sp. TAF61]|uniref:tetratricopeptide repeat protein n=1 Tax=Lysobacter sp. TAF61 TaxID=3233072 RepID=UPI003F9E1CC2